MRLYLSKVSIKTAESTEAETKRFFSARADAIKFADAGRSVGQGEEFQGSRVQRIEFPHSPLKPVLLKILNRQPFNATITDVWTSDRPDAADSQISI